MITLYELLSIEEVAKYLRVSIPTIRLWIIQERFPVVKLGGRVLVKQEEINKFIEKNIRPMKAEGVDNAKD